MGQDNLEAHSYRPAAFRFTFYAILGLLLLNCSGLLTFEVREFEPLSATLLGSETDAGYQRVTLDHDWETKRFRVIRDGITVWLERGGQTWTGYNGSPRSTYFIILIENESEQALTFNSNGVRLVPTRVRPRRMRNDFMDMSAPLVKTWMSPEPDVELKWPNSADSSSLPTETIDIEPGSTLRIHFEFDLPVRMRRGYFDITLLGNQNKNSYVYRFWVKKD